MTPIAHTVIDAPVGPLHLLADEPTHDDQPAGLRALLWADLETELKRVRIEAEALIDTEVPIFDEVRRQLVEYFEGTRTEFAVDLDPHGTEFQRTVWDSLRRIPFGVTSSYAQQARAINRPTAVRAVASANGRNPISIVVPCHRVIGADGSLTGFAGGLEVKRWLLDHERHHLMR
jgi:methylated-DNA-[protein]-cysteine S-methyltransferase